MCRLFPVPQEEMGHWIPLKVEPHEEAGEMRNEHDVSMMFDAIRYNTGETLYWFHADICMYICGDTYIHIWNWCVCMRRIGW